MEPEWDDYLKTQQFRNAQFRNGIIKCQTGESEEERIQNFMKTLKDGEKAVKIVDKEEEGCFLRDDLTRTAFLGMNVCE